MYRFILCLLGSLLLMTSASSQEVIAEDQPPAAEAHFDVWEFQVEGASLLPKATVENLVYPFLGSGKTLADVEGAKRNLEQAYRDAGYAAVLVNIPEQDASHGVVRLQVIESKIDRLRITGTRYFSPQDLRGELPALAPGNPLHLPSLQAQLAAANSTAPDRGLNPIFRPGMEPGTMEVELKVEDHVPLHGSVGINNRYTQGSSRLRLEAGLSYANLWQRHHSVSLNYQASPQHWGDVRVWMLGYAIPVENARWQFSAIHSVSSSAALGTLGVLGNGNVYSVTWQRQLPGDQNINQGLSLGVEYKGQKQNVLLPDGNGISTPISYSVAHAQYNRMQRDDHGSTSYSVSGAFGLRLLGNDQEEFRNKRYNAKANFSHLNADIERLHAGFKNTTWRLHVAGQLSDSPLISNEQFNAGGADTVRGYPESQAMGDDALLVNLELRSPPLASERWSVVKDLQALVFADSAWLKRQYPLPSEQERQHLAGAGVGARTMVAKNFNVAVDWASPLEDAGSIKRGDSRFHFNIRYEF